MSSNSSRSEAAYAVAPADSSTTSPVQEPSPAQGRSGWSGQADVVAHPHRWLIMVITLCASVMNQLDTTIINVAAPSIRADLGGGPSTLQWFSAAYTLSFAVFLVIGGRLGDIYGRRTMFLVGAAGFTLASVACGLAFSSGVLIGARVVQGVFGALLIPQGLGIVRSVFPQRELGTAFGLFAPIMGLASVSGPILGGALINADVFGTGWRMVFLINLPIGIFAVLGAQLVVPREQERLKIKLDLAGVAILTLAAVLVIYPLVQGRSLGWPVWTWLMLLAGVAAFGLFGLYESRTRRDPVIEPALFRNRVFIAGLTIAIVFFGAVSGVILAFSLYLQIGLHFTPVHAALTGLPMSLGIAVAGLVATKLTARFGRHVLHAGLSLVILGLLVLAWSVHHFGAQISSVDLLPSTVVTGFGLGLVFGPLFRVILGGIGQREIGSASGTLTAVQQFGGSIGVGAIGTLYFSLSSAPGATVSGMVATTLVVAAVAAAAFGLIFLLPNKKLASW